MDEGIVYGIIVLLIFILYFAVRYIAKTYHLSLAKRRIEECMELTNNKNSYELANSIMDLAIKEGFYETLSDNESYERYKRNQEFLNKILEYYRNELTRVFFENSNYYIEKIGSNNNGKFRLSSLNNPDFLYATLYYFTGYDDYRMTILYDVVDNNTEGHPVTDFGIYYQIFRFSMLYLMSLENRWAVKAYKGYRISPNDDIKEHDREKMIVMNIINGFGWYW